MLSVVAKRTWAPASRSERLVVGVVALAALALGVVLGSSKHASFYGVLGGMLVLGCLFLTRRDALIGAVTVAAAILLDFYQLINLPDYYPAVATTIAALAILIFSLFRSREHPWTRTPYLWIWALILPLAALEIPLSESASGALHYFVAILVNMPLAYILGIQIGRETRRLKELLIALSVLATLISAHAIIQALTGKFLFLTPTWASIIAVQGGYSLDSTDSARVGSFLINPDNLGTYLGVMLPILLGLGIALKERWAKVAAFGGAALAAMGLLFSYAATSWLAVGVGLVVMFFFVAHGKVRAYLLSAALLLAAVLGVLFPSSVQMLIGHATAPSEIQLRIGTWETGLNILAHNPLTGIGMGYINYLHRAVPYLSPLQVIVGNAKQLEQPQNSFLELAANGGVPVMLFYMLVLGLCFAAAGRNFLRARGRDRVLIGAVLSGLISLTVTSLATPGWTFPATGLLGWLLLGAVSSPALLSSADSAGARADQDAHGEALSPELAVNAARKEGA